MKSFEALWQLKQKHQEFTRFYVSDPSSNNKFPWGVKNFFSFFFSVATLIKNGLTFLGVKQYQSFEYSSRILR